MADFNRTDIPEKTYNDFLGISKQHFERLFCFCEGHLHNSSNRTTRNALAMLLMKLRTNLSQEQIGSMFNLDQQRVSDTINS